MKKYIALILLLLCFVTIGINADEDNNNILKFRRSEAEHQTLASAVCISANSIEDLAIGFSDKYINVYDKNGNFKYSYVFEFNGSYVFEFDSLNNIMILPARGDSSYYFNSGAELLKTKKISNSGENDKYYRTLLNNKSINANGNKYVLEQSFGYTRLVKTDINGNEKVIYDSGSKYIGKIIAGVFILAFVIIVIFVIARTIKTEAERFRNASKP